jgi:hypothetical protein
VGNIKECPSCGGHVKSFEINCKECGHEFSVLKCLSELVFKLSNLPYQIRKGVFDFNWQIKNQNVDHQGDQVIQNHKIKNTKQDLFDFLNYFEQFL